MPNNNVEDACTIRCPYIGHFFSFSSSFFQNASPSDPSSAKGSCLPIARQDDALFQHKIISRQKSVNSGFFWRIHPTPVYEA